MEYVEGTNLAASWSKYSEPEKEKVARRIAEIFVEFPEDRFEGMYVVPNPPRQITDLRF